MYLKRAGSSPLIDDLYSGNGGPVGKGNRRYGIAAANDRGKSSISGSGTDAWRVKAFAEPSSGIANAAGDTLSVRGRAA